MNVCEYLKILHVTFFKLWKFVEGDNPSYFWYLTVYSGCHIFVIWLFTVVVFYPFFSCLPLLTLKEAVNESRVNVINKGSIKVVCHIYHPPPPSLLIPMESEIKRIKYFVTFTVVPDTNATILKVINALRISTSMFLLQQ